ncbi:hypothetical protein JOE29_004795 [Pseudomonas sp. PvP009]|nr:hypothetical protein [Pseudomonas sp. PvP009]
MLKQTSHGTQWLGSLDGSHDQRLLWSQAL